MPKVYYVANARMPGEKAHGIQIAKMCEAFTVLGVDLVLVVPRRHTHTGTLKEFYGLTHEVPVLRVPVPDLYRTGRFGFALSSLVFMVLTELYLWSKKVCGERFVVYTIDMDNFSYALLPLAGATVTEMHTPKSPSWVQRFFFSRVRGVIATNGLIRQRFIDGYHLSESRVVVECNGVDLDAFSASMSRADARAALSLPQDAQIVLYVGRFYQWKGLDILLPACGLVPASVRWYIVGGTKEEFLKVTGVSEVPDNLVFVGERSAGEIPQWVRAADVLLQLGTNTNEDSSRYTSPMKLFEYMASGTPIVASATPAIVDVLSQDEAYLFEPDDAQSLARTISIALTAPDTTNRAARACVKVQELTWQKRAERILAFITRTDTLK